MKKSGILALSLVLVLMSFTNPIVKVTKSVSIDIENSLINWKGYKPTGSHEGTILFNSGAIELEDEKILGGSFEVAMATLKDADGSKRLEGHLKAKDFFEVEVFPTSQFEITNVKEEEGKSIITGNMVIKGISKEISFPAVVSITENSVSLKSETIKINRADFNIKYKSKSFFNNLKEKFINDEFDIQVTLVANR